MLACLCLAPAARSTLLTRTPGSPLAQVAGSPTRRLATVDANADHNAVAPRNIRPPEPLAKDAILLGLKGMASEEGNGTEAAGVAEALMAHVVSFGDLDRAADAAEITPAPTARHAGQGGAAASSPAVGSSYRVTRSSEQLAWARRTPLAARLAAIRNKSRSVPTNLNSPLVAKSLDTAGGAGNLNESVATASSLNMSGSMRSFLQTGHCARTTFV